MPVPTEPTPHVPGQPANAWSIGFDWNNKATATTGDHAGNGLEIARLAPVVDIISKVRKLLAVEEWSDKEGGSLLATIASRRLDLMVNLCPFPMDGTNADLTLDDLRMVMVVWPAMKQWMTTSQTFQAIGPPSDGYPDGTPFSFSCVPLDLFRKVMTTEKVNL